MITIIIPALNEPYLETLKKDIAVCMADHFCEILIQREKGLSNAVWCGVQNSSGKIIVVMDGDGSHDPRDILPLVSMLGEGVDVVVGCRKESFEPLYRKLINKILAVLVRAFLRIKVSDPLSGFIVGKREKFKFEERDGFKFGLEVLVNNNHHIAEYPIVFGRRKGGDSKAGPLHLFMLLKQVGRLMFEHHESLQRNKKSGRE